MTLTDDKVMKDIRSLNERFHSEALDPKGLYQALRQLGVEPSHSILISIYPDSGNTWCGELVDENMRPMQFEVDATEHTNSTVRQIEDGRFSNRRGQILWAAVETLYAEL